jgi:anti-anti-sigma factor
MSRDLTPPPGRLNVTSEIEGDSARLMLEGELDLASAGQVEEQLASLEARSPRRIVVHLDGLAFIDSTGLRTLIQADARAREKGTELVLRPGDESIQRVFELTGALDVLRFETSAEDSPTG